MRDEVFNDCLKTQSKMGGANKPFWSKLAEKWGYDNPEKLRSAFKREKKKRGMNSTSDSERTTYEQGDDYINIVCSSKRIKTKEDVIKEFNIDMTKWKIEKFVVRTDEAWRKDRKVQWEVQDGKVLQGSVDDSGKILLVPLTRVEVRFIPIELESLSSDDLINFYNKKEFVSKIKFPKFIKKGDDILEWDITDCHIGARYFNQNWKDLEDIFPNIASQILQEIRGRKFSKIIVPFLGDVFHFEGRQQKTERHGQYVEGNGMNPLEMYDYAKNMFISVLDELLTVAPVEVVYVPGNHDGTSLYYLINAFSCWYRNTKTFSANLGHESQKYYLIGKNLLGLEHGDAPKKNRVHWLQNVARREWGVSQYAEVHYGHLHSEEVTEYGGVKLRRLPPITPTDFWHHRNEYIGSIRASMCFVWNEDKIGWTQNWQTTGI